MIHSDEDLSSTFFHIQTQTGWGRTLARLANWCHPKQDSVALDVGCGPGLLPALLAERGCRSFGVDISWDAFVEGRLHPDLIQGSAQTLPFASNTFHLITASNLLFLLNDPLPVLFEFKRLLRADGQVVVLNPSEHLCQASAKELAENRSLDQTSRISLLNWASLAEKHWRWTETDLHNLFLAASLRLVESQLIMGPGIGLLARALPHRS